MGKWWHSIGSVAMLVLTAISPELQGLISGHPAIAAGIGFAYAILGHILPSPLPPAVPAKP